MAIELTDAELAGMVRRSDYLQRENLGTGPGEHRFLLVFAVPYGLRDGIDTATEALEAALAFLSDDDNDERRFQVFDAAASQRFYSASLEECELDVAITS